jgi:ribose 5-phosphate isomerase B
MIAIGSDHGGYKLKEEIKKYLEETGIKFVDVGTHTEERTDYPVYAKEVCKKIQAKEADRGILICKSGLGMAIVANKFKGIRCAACYTENAAKSAKEHSNVNVLALPAEELNISKAVVLIRTWIASEYLGGRYNDRLQMINEIESENMK